MSAIGSLRTAVGALLGSPVLFLAALVYGLVVLPQNALSLVGVPLLPQLIQVLTFFVTPFLLAGIVGMAAEAIEDGDTRLGTLVGVGKSRYLTMLLGKLAETAIFVVFFILAFFGVLFAVIGAGVGGGFAAGNAGPAALLPLLAVVALVVIPFLLVTFFIQFFPVAIVVEEAGAVESFKRSYAVVRNNLLSALGYSVVSLAVSLLLGAPLGGYVLFRSLGASGPGMDATTGAPGAAPVPDPTSVATPFSPPEIAGVAALSLALTTVLFAFRNAYAVAFFAEHRTARAATPTEPAADADADRSGVDPR
ncbi:DUF7847 domain-containing protein [Halegenticoccus soli]|uniref:DUF7847 domain-containing protein n=1 Tax=Halegenticoccus soli TaxID=1985678 RepID=UPI000C6EC564|nr:hypothetical protein [Halegenticoccus soli]